MTSPDRPDSRRRGGLGALAEGVSMMAAMAVSPAKAVAHLAKRPASTPTASLAACIPKRAACLPATVPTFKWADVAGKKVKELPDWIIFLFAAIIYHIVIPAAEKGRRDRRSSAGGELMVRAVETHEFPVEQLGLRRKANRTAHGPMLNFVVQAMRHPGRLVAGTSIEEWRQNEVYFTPESLWDYLQQSTEQRSRFGRGNHLVPAWRHERERVLTLLRDVTVTNNFRLLFDDLESGAVAPVSEHDAWAWKPPRRGPQPVAPASGRRLLAAGQVDVLKEERDKLRVENAALVLEAAAQRARAERAEERQLLLPARLNASIIKLDDKVNSIVAETGSTLFEPEAIAAMTTEERSTARQADRLVAFNPDTLDTLVESDPVMKEVLYDSMTPVHRSAITPERLALRVRQTFFMLLLIARVRAVKAVSGRTATLAPLLLTVIMIAHNSTPIVVDTLQQLVMCCVTYKTAATLLQKISELMPLSYPHWFKGEMVGFWTDNFQMSKEWTRQLLTRKNSIATNCLLQAAIWMVWVLRPWWLPVPLASFGVPHVPIDDLQPEHFGVWPPNDPRHRHNPFCWNVWKEMSPYWGHTPGGVGRSGTWSDAAFLLRKKAFKYCWRTQASKYPSDRFKVPLHEEHQPETGAGGRLLPRAEWKRSTYRLGRVLCLPTNKPEEVGRLHSQLIRWFGIGSSARPWCLFNGDWLLFRGHLSACSMTLSAAAGRFGIAVADLARVLAASLSDLAAAVMPTGAASTAAAAAPASTAPAAAPATASAPAAAAGPLGGATLSAIAGAVNVAAPPSQAAAPQLTARKRAGITFSVSKVPKTLAGFDAWYAQSPKPVKLAVQALAEEWRFDPQTDLRHLQSLTGYPTGPNDRTQTKVFELRAAALVFVLRHFLAGLAASTPAPPAGAAGAAQPTPPSASPPPSTPPPAAPPPAEETALRAAVATLRMQQAPFRPSQASSLFDPLELVQALLQDTDNGTLPPLWQTYREELPRARAMPRLRRDEWLRGWFARCEQRLSDLQALAVGGPAAALLADLKRHVPDAVNEAAATSGLAPAAAGAISGAMLAELSSFDPDPSPERANELARYAAALGQARQDEATRPAPSDDDKLTPTIPDDLAYPDLLCGHGGFGGWHMMVQGGIAMLFKMKYHYLFRFVGHDVLKRKSVSEKIKSVFIAIEIFYHTREVLVMLMFFAFEEAAAAGGIDIASSPERYCDEFWRWYCSGMRSGDEVFRYYSDVVLGSGLVWHTLYQALKTMDVVKVWASLPILAALFHITDKRNLKSQAVLTMMKLLSVEREVAESMLANVQM